ncbi:MAG: ABC transporter permease, partial [Thermoplasmata archaeon]
FFLIIVALSTYVLLSRLVYVQRSHIGTLRALGYAKGTILAHYLGYALFLGLLGSLVGFGLGYLLSYPVTGLFAEATNLRNVPILVRLDILAVGAGLSLGFTAMAGIVPAWRASRLGPAEAMRPPVPTGGRKPLVERIFPRLARVSPTLKLSIRNILRNRRRALFTILGLGLAVSVLLIPLSFVDSMDWATNAQLERIQRYDLKVHLQYPMGVANLTSLDALEEVAVVEPLIEVPTSLMKDGEAESILIMALEPSGRLYGLYDRSWEPAETGEGLLVSRIYERKGFGVGDEVQILSYSTEITGFVSDFGTTGFVTLARAQAWLGLEGMATAVMLEMSPGFTEEDVKESLSAILPVLAFESTQESIADWNEMMALYYGFIYLLLVFGGAISVAIVFNAVTMNVLEESRDLATMRTFGTPFSQLRRLITAETLLLVIPGAILGLVLGTYLTGYFTSFYSSDLFVLDPVISLRTYLISFGAALLVALLSELPSLRHVRGMSLAKLTKERVS